MRYHVLALDDDQSVRSLTVEATDEPDARARTRAQHLVPISAQPEKKKLFGGGTTKFSILLFAQELHALLGAGLAIVESLDALAEREASSEWLPVLEGLAARVRNGDKLSSALLVYCDIFPPLFVGIVQAAEKTSDLPRALSRYIDYEDRLLSVRQRVVSSIIYPTILLVVGGAVCLFLLGYVVPRFSVVYAASGRTLPWASQVLFAWGLFAAKHAWELTIGFLVIATFSIGAGVAALRSSGWWQILSVIPGAARRLHTLEVSRLYVTLGMLLEGGIALHQALQLAATMLSPKRRPGVESVRQSISGGSAPSYALASAGLSTAIGIRLVRAGEQSGQLGQMLIRAAQYHEGEISRWLERFSRAFEPILMAIIGLVVGAIVVLLYMPIFDLAGTLQSP